MLALALLVAMAPLTDVDADVAVVRATHEVQLLQAAQHATEIRLAGGGTVISGGFLPRSGGTLTGPIYGLSNACSTPAYAFDTAQTTGMALVAAGRVGICFSGSEWYDLQATQFWNITGVDRMSEASAPTPAAGSSFIYADSTAHAAELSNAGDAFARIARFSGAAQSGAYTNATNGFTTVTGVSVTLPIGQWYCESSARFTQSTAGEGATFQLTSTAGSISGGGVSSYGNGEQYDAAALADSKDSATQTIATTDASVSAGHVVLRSAVNVATTMTYVLQGAEAAAHVSGTVTVAGAAIQCTHM